MFKVFGRPHSIHDLKGMINPPAGIDRKSVPIGIIDDERFPKMDALIRHDFNVKELGDITDIKAVQSYPIVLCDIKGVGNSFGSPFEGGHVIEEIKKYYPSKILVAYTGQQFDPTFNQFFRLCDYSLKKDLASDEWIKYLDEAIRIATDPVRQWLKTRERLITMEISALHLLKLEDEFVKKAIGKQARFPSESLANDLPSDVRTIVLNLVSNIIFKTTIG